MNEWMVGTSTRKSLNVLGYSLAFFFSPSLELMAQRKNERKVVSKSRTECRYSQGLRVVYKRGISSC